MTAAPVLLFCLPVLPTLTTPCVEGRSKERGAPGGRCNTEQGPDLSYIIQPCSQGFSPASLRQPAKSKKWVIAHSACVPRHLPLQPTLSLVAMETFFHILNQDLMIDSMCYVQVRPRLWVGLPLQLLQSALTSAQCADAKCTIGRHRHPRANMRSKWIGQL
jgi:hypothetical protein